MLDWLLAGALFGLFLLALPRVLSRAETGARKGGGGGFAIGLFMFFASVFDPAKAAAIEQLDKKKDTEGSEKGESGAPPQ